MDLNLLCGWNDGINFNTVKRDSLFYQLIWKWSLNIKPILTIQNRKSMVILVSYNNISGLFCRFYSRNSRLFLVTGLNFEKRIRKDHPLRKIDEKIDFDFIYKEVEDTYGQKVRWYYILICGSSPDLLGERRLKNILSHVTKSLSIDPYE